MSRYVIPAPSAVVVAFADGLLHGATLHGLRVTLTEVLAGLDVGFTVALPGAIAAEFVGSSEGLGYAIMQQQFSVDLPGAFANLARLGLIGVIGHGVMAVLRRRMVVWDVA